MSHLQFKITFFILSIFIISSCSDDDEVECPNIWYEDADNDGLGNPEVSTVSCLQPDGFVDNDSDDDDTIACTEVTWYEDADGDLLGNPAVSQTSCLQPDGFVDNADDDDDTTKGPFENGIFIINEGGFSASNPSITFIDSDQTITQNAFQFANSSTTIGTILQSVTFHNNLIYMIVNVSNRVIVANRYTLEQQSVLEEIDELNNPRYMAVVGSTGYITNWGNGSDPNDDFVTIVNLEDNTVQGTISVVEGPEQIAVFNNQLYVLHRGGFGQNNQVTVINPNTNQVNTTLTIGDVPDSFQIVNNQLNILCRGRVGSDFVTPETAAEIWTVDAGNNASLTYDFENLGLAGGIPLASNLNVSGNQIFVQVTTTDDNGVYSFTAGDFENAEKIIDRNFYQMSLVEDELYGFDAGDFSSNGTAIVYNTSGVESRTIDAGVIPRMAIKNE